MNYPAGTKVAFLYNDTTNFLNASAFRIAYIPSLVEKISLADYALTIFILLLSLFIATIVISRYLSLNRKIIGVMRANGINKRSIAVSLLPFSIIPTVIGGICGYFAGLFLQVPALGLFNSY
jgi:putative ABC transport system permease protein